MQLRRSGAARRVERRRPPAPSTSQPPGSGRPILPLTRSPRASDRAGRALSAGPRTAPRGPAGQRFWPVQLDLVHGKGEAREIWPGWRPWCRRRRRRRRSRGDARRQHALYSARLRPVQAGHRHRIGRVPGRCAPEAMRAETLHLRQRPPCVGGVGLPFVPLSPLALHLPAGVCTVCNKIPLHPHWAVDVSACSLGATRRGGVGSLVVTLHCTQVSSLCPRCLCKPKPPSPLLLLSPQHLQKILRAEQKAGAGHSSKALLSMLLVADSRPWELLSASKTPKWHCLRRCVVCQGGWAAVGQRNGPCIPPGCFCSPGAVAAQQGQPGAMPAIPASQACWPCLTRLSCTHPPLQRA